MRHLGEREVTRLVSVWPKLHNTPKAHNGATSSSSLNLFIKIQLGLASLREIVLTQIMNPIRRKGSASAQLFPICSLLQCDYMYLLPLPPISLACMMASAPRVNDLGKCNNLECKMGCGCFYCANPDPNKALQVTLSLCWLNLTCKGSAKLNTNSNCEGRCHVSTSPGSACSSASALQRVETQMLSGSMNQETEVNMVSAVCFEPFEPHPQHCPSL